MTWNGCFCVKKSNFQSCAKIKKVQSSKKCLFLRKDCSNYMQRKVINRIFLTLFCTFVVSAVFAQALTADEQIADLRLRAIDFDQKTAEWLETIKTRRINSEEALADLDEKAATKTQLINLKKAIQTLQKKENNALTLRRDASEHLIEANAAQKLAEKKKIKRIIELDKAYYKLLANFEILKASEMPDAKTLAAIAPHTPPPAATEVLNEAKSEKVAPPTQVDNYAATVGNPSSNDAVMRDEKLMIAPEKKEKKEKKEKPKKSKKEKKQADNATETPTANAETIASTPTAKPKPTLAPIKYNAAEDVTRNPPTPKCVIDYDGKDAFSGKNKRVLASQFWFASTDDLMRPVMGERDYVRCDAQITQIEGGFVFLNLTFTIQSKEAQRAFGFLDRSSILGIRLMNGRNVSLAATKTDIGTLDEKRGSTTYKTQYSLQAKDISMLQNSEVDVVRVAWSAGFEDYDVTNIDLLMNLFRCLK